MTTIPTVISQHAEEAAMLWLLRRAAVAAPHYSLADLAKIDGRVEAHLDGLRIAGEDGWKLCEEQLAANEEGEVFAAGVLAFESGRPERVAKVLAAAEQEPKLAGAVVSALGWLTAEQALPHLQTLLQSEKPVCQRIAVGGFAAHRRHPGEALARFVRAEEPALRARALQAAGELQDQALTRAVSDALGDADAECRFAAAWAGTPLGVSGAVAVLREMAESDSHRAPAAARLAARRMDGGSALVWQKQLASDLKHLRLSIAFAGAFGEPSVVPWLISLMGELPLARAAGEAFTFITGADLAWRDLERKPPEDFAAGPTEDPKDENVEMDADDNLPWPEPELVRKWWAQHEREFQTGTRHLLGKPMTPEWLQTVLRDGRQRHRAVAAVELAIRNPGQPLFNVEAAGFRQIKLLGKPGPVLR